MLLTRAWPPVERAAEFDRFQRHEHLPQLMDAPGARQALYYETIVERLPAICQGSGSRLVEYRCGSVDDLFAWLRSDELAAAVKDGGARWFGRMNELDGALYTGNIYNVDEVIGRRATDAPDECTLLLERFEVGAQAEEFDRWAVDEHLPDLAVAPGVFGVRYCAAIRGQSPIPYYESPGDRAVLVAVDPAVSPADAAVEPTLLAAVQDSLRWDSLLSYVRREVYGFICTVRASKEAAA